jgi:Spy/CpxP family protein refolding chaperone
MNRLAIRVTVVAGFLLHCATPALTRAQSVQPGSAQAPRMLSPAPRPIHAPRAADDFAGLKYTDEQQAKIDEIHQRMQKRKDTVIKDEKLSGDQKNAMLTGLKRMESGEIFRSLTPEQQKEVLKNVHARRAAAQEEDKKTAPPR